MLAGVAIGKLMPAAIAGLRSFEFGKGSDIDVPIAVLIWLMITPMMARAGVGERSHHAIGLRADCAVSGA